MKCPTCQHRLTLTGQRIAAHWRDDFYTCFHCKARFATCTDLLANRLPTSAARMAYSAHYTQHRSATV